MASATPLVAGRSRSIEHDANLFSCTKPALHSHLHRLRDRQPCAVLNHACAQRSCPCGAQKGAHLRGENALRCCIGDVYNSMEVCAACGCRWPGRG